MFSLTKDKFISSYSPEKMGNSADIAFGGCVLSMSLNAGVSAIPANFFCYSAQGYYLGPTLASDRLVFVISRVRDTKTFKTVRVDAKQVQRNVERTTFTIIMDFQVKEAPVLAYNLNPRFRHAGPESCIEYVKELEARVAQGSLDPNLFKTWFNGFALIRRFFEIRQCEDSVARQNILGMDKKAKTTQDHLLITQKCSAHWFRALTSLSHAESYAAVSFVTDAALAFLPATFRNEFLDDYGALSTLDCSLRFHTSDFSCNDWLLHEQVTEAANDGRTYSTGRIFREDGVLVATMTQMSILRPKAVKAVQEKI